MEDEIEVGYWGIDMDRESRSEEKYEKERGVKPSFVVNKCWEKGRGPIIKRVHGRKHQRLRLLSVVILNERP